MIALTRYTANKVTDCDLDELKFNKEISEIIFDRAITKYCGKIPKCYPTK